MKHTSALSLDFRADRFDHPSGLVDAGTVIAWVDKVAYAVAAGWAGVYARARYIGTMQFTRRVPVDTRVTAQARVVHTYGPHVHVQTRVLLPDLPDADGAPVVACTSIAVYTAEESGVRVPVPPWMPSTPRQVERDVQARESTLARRAVERGMADLPFPRPGDAAAEHMTTLSFLAPASEATVGGTVTAGAILRWVDEAAGVCAARWTGHESVVAVFAGGVRFVRPVYVGELVRVDALLVHTSTRSMHVALRVHAGPRGSAEPRLVAHSIAVMVDLDDDGRPVAVPPYVPATEDARRLEESAAQLLSLRSAAAAAWTDVKRQEAPSSGAPGGD